MAKIEDKESILKPAREKTTSFKDRGSQKSITDFSVETLQTRKQWHNIFNVMRRKKLTTKNILSGRI